MEAHLEMAIQLLQLLQGVEIMGLLQEGVRGDVQDMEAWVVQVMVVIAVGMVAQVDGVQDLEVQVKLQAAQEVMVKQVMGMEVVKAGIGRLQEATVGESLDMGVALEAMEVKVGQQAVEFVVLDTAGYGDGHAVSGYQDTTWRSGSAEPYGAAPGGYGSAAPEGYGGTVDTSGAGYGGGYCESGRQARGPDARFIAYPDHSGY